MFSLAINIARKDLRALLAEGGVAGAFLLGLLVIFVFSLSQNTGQSAAPEEAAAIFWLGTLFCQTLIFNQLYALEEKNDVKKGLLLGAAPVQGVWLGKFLAALPLAFISQTLFAIAIAIFLNRYLNLGAGSGLFGALLADVGICAAGSLLAAANGSVGKDSLTAIVLFPLLAPALLGGVALLADAGDALSWLGLLGAFDALFVGAALILFPFVYGSEC